MLVEIDDVDDGGYVLAYLTQDRIEGRFQQSYEPILQRREMAKKPPHFSRTPQQPPNSFEFTGKGY